MKVKFFVYTQAVGLALAGLTACSDDFMVDDSRQDNTLIVAEIADTETEPVSRTVVDEPTDGGDTGICWSPSDVIGVYDAVGIVRNAAFTSTNSTVAGTAEFRGTMQGTPAYAYYPYREENNGVASDAVKGELPAVQEYSTADGRLGYDWKIGMPKEGDNNKKFAFTHLFAMLRFAVDATGTELAGDILESITLELPEGYPVGGEFTVNLANREVAWSKTAGSLLKLDFTDLPSLTSGSTLRGYLVCAPIAVGGKNVTVKLLTHKYEASFTTVLKTDFVANSVYTFPLTLARWAENGMTVKERPVISSFSFTASKNRGKILDKKLVFNESSSSWPWGGNSGSTSVTQDVSATTVSMSISEDNRIEGTVPYLYDFSLVPEIVCPEGAVLSVGDGETFTAYQSGNPIDFSTPVVIRVEKDGMYSDYTVSLTNSGLPVMVIDQEGGDTSWSETGFKIYSKNTGFDAISGGKITVYNADGTKAELADADAAVRLRGNSTQNYPKKPFAIKLGKKSDILGIMEGKKHKRWVLLANYKDRSLMRNAVAFDLARVIQQTLPDGMGWNLRGKFVEVVYNGVHIGNYYLCEQIKVDGSRVAVSDPYETAEGAITEADIAKYGYLLESDDYYDETAKFTTRNYLPFMFKDDVDAGGVIMNYVRTKVQRIEDNLYNGNYMTAYEEMDLNSFIDYWMLYELAMNNELGHPKSTYTYMDGTGKLFAGPVWDFDWQSFPNYKSPTITDWSKYSINSSILVAANPWRKSSGTPGAPVEESDQPYMWYPMLFKDTETFRPLAKERWEQVRGALTAYAPKVLEMGRMLEKSVAANDAMWPINNKNVRDRYVGSYGYIGDETLTFEESYTALYNTLLERIDGMDFISSGTYPNISYTLK